MLQKIKLANGLRLLIVPVAGTKAITAMALFGVGSRYETVEENGLSHFIEHVMFKGTARRPTTLDLSRELDAVGAEYNAYTSRDHTGYYVKVDASHAELAVDMLSDMLINSKFDSAELEKEKGVIVEEINMYQDNPTMYVEQLFEETLFPNHPLGRDIAGTAETVTKFTRETMVGYRDKYYQPANGVLVLAGQVDSAAVVLAKKVFGSVKKRSAVPKFEKFSQFSATPLIGLKYKETDQTHLVLGFPGYSYDDKKAVPLSLLNLIVGGTMSSRLFIEVRERRGLAYMVRSDSNRYHETGNFVIQAGLDSSRAAEAVKVLRQELEKVKSGGVTEDELRLAKENLRGHLVLSFENSSTQAEWYGKQALLMKKIMTPEEKMAQLAKAKVGDLRRLAQELFDFRRAAMAVIGPYKDKEQIAGWLKGKI